MTTFKAFLKIVKKNLWLIIMYSAILVFCVVGNNHTSTGITNFTATKPQVLVYDHDESEISKNLTKYIYDRSNQPKIADRDDGLDDALYYNNVDYVIFLEKDFGKKVANGEKPKIEVKSAKNYDAYLAETILNRYMGVVNSIAPASETEIVKSAEVVLKNETKAELTTKIDTTALSNLARFFTFLNYPIIAGLVFMVAYTTASFKREMTKKRMMVSATSYRSINSKLLIYNYGIAMILLVMYIVLGLILNGDMMFTSYGWLMILNAAFMSVFATTFALLLTNLLHSNNAILAVVNVTAIGSSFLAGVFVPIEWMPEAVVNLGRILPSYYYTNSNTVLTSIEEFNFETLQPVFINLAVLLGATIITIIINNILTKKQK